jgi:hypothetical protein
MKTCSKCGIEKDESEFSLDKNSKDGYSYRCKKCALISTRYYTLRRKLIEKAVLPIDYLKKCTMCGKIKSKDEFHKNINATDGLSFHCKDCKREYDKKRYNQDEPPYDSNKLQSDIIPRYPITTVKYCNGLLSCTSDRGWAVITEHITCVVLGDCININKECFISPIDLYSKRYGNIDVKSSKLSYHKNSYNWNFRKRRRSKIPDYFMCIGFNEDKTQIVKVWLIPSGSDVVNTLGIYITNSNSGLERVYTYELDPTPYNEVYQDLDLTMLYEFRNLNVHSIEEMLQTS